jgi:BirA family biotin operon repressor/biotin-[acetyl-CoA-carboxylase] ligase
VAPFASGLCLSLNWSYPDAPATLAALSLAVGVAALRALGRLGISGLALKWPNDIVQEDRKLGGILIDLRSEAAGPAYVVVGIGINVRLPASARERLAIEARAVDLATLGEPPPRNALAAALIAELSTALVEYGARGMSAFADEWRDRTRWQDGRLPSCTAGRCWRPGARRGRRRSPAPRSRRVSRRIVSGEVSVRPCGVKLTSCV